MDFFASGTKVTVNIPTRDVLETRLRSCLRARRGFALATLNLDHLVKLRSDAAFRQAYAQQDFVTADGNPIVWLSRLARQPVTLLPGSDLVIPMLRMAADAGVPVAFVGSTDAALTAAADAVVRAVPGIEIRRRIAPPFGFDPEGPAAAEILDTLSQDGIGLCLVALGAPKQERFAAFGRSRAPRVGFASIGAGLDFLAGHQKRAPEWVRRLALEWLWRAASNPGRLAARYARCALILPELVIAAARQRKPGRAA
jgi:exopolysaccharide biosynthesis WecB/TagA/CpsF family protein